MIQNRTPASLVTGKAAVLALLALGAAVSAPQAQQELIGEEAEDLFRRARSCIEDENDDCASQALDQASRLDLNQWEAAQLWNMRGLVEVALGNASQAATAYENALRTSGLPSSLRRQAQLALAELYVQGGQHEQALSTLGDARKTNAPTSRPPTGEWLPILTIAPDYPAEAAAAGLEEGYVVVAFTVTASGGVENPRVVEASSQLFAAPAFEAARKWRYVPHVEDGEPVAVKDVTTVFRFRLDDYLERVTSSARRPLAAADAPSAQPGQYEVMSERAFGLPGLLVFRPADLELVALGDSLPVVVWANGGCSRISDVYAGFLATVASHGFLVIATAPIEPASRWFTTVDDLRAALNWAEGEARRQGSPLNGKIATDRVGALGQSCGGELAVDLGTDPRVDTVGVFNSDVFGSHVPGTRKDAYLNLHGPVLLLNGHELDHTMAGSAASFDAINDIPVFYGARRDAGHLATFLHPGGGEFANVVSNWLRYTLKSDAAAGNTFVGEACVLCTNENWETRAKMLQ